MSNLSHFKRCIKNYGPDKCWTCNLYKATYFIYSINGNEYYVFCEFCYCGDEVDNKKYISLNEEEFKKKCMLIGLLG